MCMCIRKSHAVPMQSLFIDYIASDSSAEKIAEYVYGLRISILYMRSRSSETPEGNAHGASNLRNSSGQP